MSRTRAVLQLDAGAVARLLGGATELEIELRHQIVNAFTRHHLRDLVNTVAWEKATAATAADLKRHTAAIVGEVVEERFKINSGQYVLRAELLAAIRRQVDDLVAAQLRELFATHEQRWVEMTKRRIDAALQDLLATALDDAARRKIQTLADERIAAVVEAEIQRRLAGGRRGREGRRPHLHRGPGESTGRGAGRRTGEGRPGPQFHPAPAVYVYPCVELVSPWLFADPAFQRWLARNAETEAELVADPRRPTLATWARRPVDGGAVIGDVFVTCTADGEGSDAPAGPADEVNMPPHCWAWIHAAVTAELATREGSPCRVVVRLVAG